MIQHWINPFEWSNRTTSIGCKKQLPQFHLCPHRISENRLTCYRHLLTTKYAVQTLLKQMNTCIDRQCKFLYLAGTRRVVSELLIWFAMHAVVLIILSSSSCIFRTSCNGLGKLAVHRIPKRSKRLIRKESRKHKHTRPIHTHTPFASKEWMKWWQTWLLKRQSFGWSQVQNDENCEASVAGESQALSHLKRHRLGKWYILLKHNNRLSHAAWEIFLPKYMSCIVVLYCAVFSSAFRTRVFLIQQ